MLDCPKFQASVELREVFEVSYSKNKRINSQIPISFIRFSMYNCICN